MIIDSSALVAIMLDEPDGPLMAETIIKAHQPQISAANWLETAIVLQDQAGDINASRLDGVVDRLKIAVSPVTFELAKAAYNAHRRFGKGRHPARLNFGDCFSYALAKTTNEPLLFKGNDFAQTDIPRALP